MTNDCGCFCNDCKRGLHVDCKAVEVEREVTPQPQVKIGFSVVITMHNQDAAKLLTPETVKFLIGDALEQSTTVDMS